MNFKIQELKRQDKIVINTFFLSSALCICCLIFLFLNITNNIIISNFLILFFKNFAIFNVFVMVFCFFKSVSLNLDMAFEERLEVEHMMLKRAFNQFSKTY